MISTVFFLISYVFFKFWLPRRSMNKQARFPLLKLDYVAIREVLEVLDPLDHINFSKASKSCRSISTIKKPCKVELRFTEYPSFVIRNGPIDPGVTWVDDQGRYENRDTWNWPDDTREYLIIHSETPFVALKEFFMYAQRLMDVEVHSVVVDMNLFEEGCSKVVDWLPSICRDFSALQIYGVHIYEEELQYLLDNLKFKVSLTLFVETREELPLKIPDTLENLHIQYGSWVTLDYIISLKMRKLSFRDTYLTNEEINVFFKSWIEMKSNQNLECFELNVSYPFDFVKVALRNVPNRIGPQIPGSTSYQTPLGQSHEVTRKDGLQATICFYKDEMDYVMIMHTRLPF
ncbi:unnamed protein product [Caenorhabditis nigoni]